MMERKALGKKIRFEVFKRDKFTCQYCGRMSPDVILEVDHIKPVAEGGDDELVNLITSCRDCNRGKGKEPLSVNEALQKQKKALSELAERREQTEMLMEWKTELVRYNKQQAEVISEYLGELTGAVLNDRGIQDAKKLLKQFSVDEILNGIDIAFAYYWDGDPENNKLWNKAWNKVGGVCYNRRKQADGTV